MFGNVLHVLCTCLLFLQTVNDDKQQISHWCRLCLMITSAALFYTFYIGLINGMICYCMFHLTGALFSM
jgi:hypothetical protein